MATTIPETMRAVVFKAPFEVSVEDKPVPIIQEPTNTILKVSSTALCGTDLHYYRGHQKSPPGFICGHEFVGHVVKLGNDVQNFQIGDHVVVPFYTACGSCFYCTRGEASRCPHGVLFGNSSPANTVDGGQAEYVRVPLANTTMVRAPTSIPEELLVLMSDIFPTGYFAASRFLKNLPPSHLSDLTIAIIGCGPVGICAIACTQYLTQSRARIFAIDPIPTRLSEAEKLGAIPLDPNSTDPHQAILAATSNRGADIVLEIVGHFDALQLAFNLIRPFGKISSVGVHTEDIHFSGPLLYGKNVTMAFGRCPVRSLFEEALDVLVEVQGKLGFLCGRKMGLEEAGKAFKLFEKGEVNDNPISFFFFLLDKTPFSPSLV
ncbi:putative alcohol dehydrogenase [Phaeomoniella chlamydospora]|uniref:Putative alcohol dehydrogenase n=1 Tax=Phaeomoniella chlamydospora TaxID=158046 RepID=A0A0G2EKF2_PHACM|nr:putative alcohol dehydrogenase [Phaeomoniella chlamydospora]